MRCRSARVPPLAILARLHVPNGRLHHWSDTARCPGRSKGRRCSTAAFAFATAMRKSLSDCRARKQDRSPRCFRRETESFASSFLHLSNGKRLAPRSARKRDPAPPRKPCSRHECPRGFARSAANPPARCVSTSCRRRWTCTFHSRKRLTSACPLHLNPRKSRSHPTAQPQWPQSTRSPANRRWDSRFAPRHSSSRRCRQHSRKRKVPVVRARRSQPARALREAARSSATAAPGITLGRTVWARQARQTPELKHRAQIGQTVMQEQKGAVSRPKSPVARQAFKDC